MQQVISQQQPSKAQRLNTEACPASVLNSQGKKAELMDRLNSKYEALHQQFEHERTLFERQLLDFEMLHFDIMDKELGLLGDNQRLMSSGTPMLRKQTSKTVAMVSRRSSWAGAHLASPSWLGIMTTSRGM